MNKKGFTLVEALIAVALLVVIIPAFGYMLKQASIALHTGNNYSAAFYAARDKMEELRTVSFNDLPALDGATFFNGKGILRIWPVSDNLLGIQLELRWREGRPPLRFFSLKGKHA